MRKQALIGGLISLACLVWVFAKLDPAELWRQARTLDFRYVLLLITLLAATFALRVLRWQILLRPVGYCAFGPLWAATIIGTTGNYLLPARLGEVMRVYATGRLSGLAMSSITATVVVERVLDGLVICIFMFGSLLFLEPSARAGSFDLYLLKGAVTGLFGIFVVLALGCAAYLRWPSPVERLICAIPDRIWPALGHKLRGLLSGFAQGLKGLASIKLMALILVQTTLIWLMYILMNTVFLPAVGLPFDPVMGAMVLVGGTLASLVPGGPGYVGSFQIAVFWALCMAGADPEKAMSYGILIWVCAFIAVVLPGFYYLYKYGFNLLELSRRAEKQA